MSKLLACLCVTIVALAASSASALTLVLDSTNSWQVTIEPGASVSRPGGQSGALAGSGIQFAIGTSNVAVFPGQTTIGSGASLGGFRPIDLVFSDVPFTIKALGSGNLYDAKLTYFFSPGEGNFGTIPNPNNSAGAAFDIQAAPEPASLSLLALGGLLMLRRRKA